MKVRPCAEFECDLPTDTIETDEEIIQVGGKTVAEEVGKILARLGCNVREPFLAGENGWQFRALIGGRRLTCQVSHIVKFLLVLDNRTFFGELFKRPPHPVYIDVLSKLADELARDPRFHGVRWYFEDEVLQDKPGADRPVSEE